MTQARTDEHPGRLSDLVRQVLTESDEGARAYLRENWLLQAMRSLREARQQANLTQEGLAQRLGTTQSAIARLENDLEGRITLHKLVDYILACGMLPRDIGLEPYEVVRQTAIASAESERAQAGKTKEGVNS